MEFFSSQEQGELRESVRRFLDSRISKADVRRLEESSTGHDAAVWAQMGEQLGLQGIAIPEQYGGLGFGFEQQVVVLEEMGRSLLRAPYFATSVLAANAILACGDESSKIALLPGIASGRTVATLALANGDGDWSPGGAPAVARHVDSGWTVDGASSLVFDGDVADVVLVAARTAAGTSLFAIDHGASGMVATELPMLDQTRRFSRVEFSATPAILVGADGAAEPGLGRTLDLACVALAAEQVGGTQAVLDMTVEYVKMRHQFGRPIGSFQAIKHACADVLLGLESSRAAVYYAAWAGAEDSPELAMAARIAVAYSSETYFRAAAQNVQFHGAIGFTWEHDAHLYLKRAKSSQLLFGHPEDHRAVALEQALA